MPTGSVQQWSFMFAAREAQPALLGIYALMAEWRALTDPRTEAQAAGIKLAWWREEVDRWASGAPVHPITRYLADVAEHAANFDPLPLGMSVEAAAAQIAGAPLERSADLGPHADALYGAPLRTAALLVGDRADQRSMLDCTTALARAQYLARSIADRGREARAGRIPFVVEELLEAGIDNADLAAEEPPARLVDYLARLRRSALESFQTAATALPPAARPTLRHLVVLAQLGAKHLNVGRPGSQAKFLWADLYCAWRAARRAAAGR